MLANIRDYEPQEIQFVLRDSIKERFPITIFDGAKSPEEIIKVVNTSFNALFPENETAVRSMDDYEIKEIREEYCLRQENEVPKRMQELEEAIDYAKRLKKEAEERYNSLLSEIRDLAAQVKDGTKEYKLSSKNTIRIALDGHYVFYSWVNEKFQLVKAERIPEWDKRSLWSQEEKNREAMYDLFGYEFPEVEHSNDYDYDNSEERDEEQGDF